MPLHHIVTSLELYQQTYTYDTGNNLTTLSHQANSGNWQQALTIHPNTLGNFYPLDKFLLLRLCWGW
jgi:hypothetical protein